MTLDGLINNLQTLPKAIQREVDEIVLSDSAQLNREQLAKGKRTDDSQIAYANGRSTYSPSYKKEKARRGKQNKFIDLNLEGDFYKSIETRKRKKGVYENTSRDTVYTGSLRPNFGGKDGDLILGLNTKASEKLNKLIIKGITKVLRSEL